MSQGSGENHPSNLQENEGPSYSNDKNKFSFKDNSMAIKGLKKVLRSVYFGIENLGKKIHVIRKKSLAKKTGRAAVRVAAQILAPILRQMQKCINGVQSVGQRLFMLAQKVKHIRTMKFSDVRRMIGRGIKGVIMKLVAFNKAHNQVFIPALIATIAISISAYVYANYTLGLNVYLDDTSVASVTKQQEFEDMLLEFEREVSVQIGEPFKTNLTFYYEFGLIKKSEAAQNSQMYEKILSRLTRVKQLSVLKVDGQVIGANESKTGLENLLNSIKAPYRQDESISYVEFDKDVEIETRLCKIDDYKSLEEIEQLLVQPKEQEVTYTIQQGDTLSAIAPRYGMTTSALINMNSEVNPTRIKPGDMVLVSKAVPMLSVKSIKTVTYEEAVPYKTENISDPSLYKNQKKVKVQGVEGSQLVMAEVVLMDGEETERRILETTPLEEPVTKVVLVGTKPLPPTAPTGVLGRPTRGKITSYFGYRGREFHTGIDIANSRGTPIYAADGGTVSFAGWKGNYGYCIIINHGNGIETLYAHNSKLYVKAGQKVAKGTQIAAMGSTGRSSGNHLHFEVRVNGVPKNPTKYVKF